MRTISKKSSKTVELEAQKQQQQHELEALEQAVKRKVIPRDQIAQYLQKAEEDLALKKRELFTKQHKTLLRTNTTSSYLIDSAGRKTKHHIIFAKTPSISGIERQRTKWGHTKRTTPVLLKRQANQGLDFYYRRQLYNMK